MGEHYAICYESPWSESIELHAICFEERELHFSMTKQGAVYELDEFSMHLDFETYVEHNELDISLIVTDNFVKGTLVGEVRKEDSNQIFVFEADFKVMK